MALPFDYIPTKAEVKHYLRKWEASPKTMAHEEALNLLFETFPLNTDKRHVLLKISVLNDFYSTQIYDVESVANHFMTIDIDKRLDEGDLDLVTDLASVTINGKDRYLYSFASKYCSHHCPETYPIYDSYVDKVLRFFKNAPVDFAYSVKDLKDYPSFVDAIRQIKEFFLLDEFTFKEFDQYLWLLGKKYYPRPTSKKKKD